MTMQSARTPADTEADLRQLHQVITDLLTVCASVAAEHAPNGTWTPAASGTAAFTEAASVIETLSRSLNQTRRDLRKISTRARRSVYPSPPPSIPAPRNAATRSTAPAEEAATTDPADGDAERP
ncbi:hypothetical protein [Streptomyces sp. YS415]|uniref:hypothetical protein n=1 Tax=Streptomyces sp. YS415 TaxID=2944806 RepID=UPI00201FE726|nr:hypothetical protein [Streptomyces sp. YS415]MCL7425534.1 hypothetical protein [Streptomyces sp. YS415]